MAWKFVQDNWDELYNRYEGGFLLCRLVKVISVVFLYLPWLTLIKPLTSSVRVNFFLSNWHSLASPALTFFYHLNSITHSPECFCNFESFGKY